MPWQKLNADLAADAAGRERGMNQAMCFQCDWRGDFTSDGCPNCHEAKVFLVIKCGCGEEVVCDGFTNICSCGADYNWSGQRLASRSQWGEETGESVADIIAVDSDTKCLFCEGVGCSECNGSGWIGGDVDAGA